MDDNYETVGYIRVGDDSIIFTKGLLSPELEIHFSDISHYDFDRGVIFKLKSGKIYWLPYLPEYDIVADKLEKFGVEKRIVNRHVRPHQKPYE